MSKLFTDDEWNEYEAVDLDAGGAFLAIKPVVRAEPKEEFGIFVQRRVMNSDKDTNLFVETLELTEPQAKAVAEAIKSLMEFIQEPFTVQMNSNNNLQRKASEARKALRNGV